MRIRGPHFWIAILSILVVVLLAVVDLRRTSPGPLTTVHQREQELQGRNGCSQCHGGWFSSMTKACLDCHELIGQQIEASQGLHGAVARDQAERCAVCHGEHHGTSFAIVNRQSFLLAGAKNPEKFDHQLVGFEMNGRHSELDCAQCHAHARDVVLAKDATRYIGLDQDCASCHADPHEGSMVLACASCHGQRTWDELHSTGHDRFLPLLGGHGDVACRECHSENGTRALEVLGTNHPAPRDCAACHESPHAKAFVEGVARQGGTSAGASCVVCHVVEHTTFREPTIEVTAAQHASSGFALEVPHEKAECADCHAPAGESFAARYPGRGADQCSACHADPHGGQFATGPFSGGDCIACHDRAHFEPHAFTVAKHALASFELTGRHVDTGCDECHEVAHEGEPRAFRGVKSDCDACHADAHGGFFDRFTAKLPEVEYGDCARCHDAETFGSVIQPRFDHATWTGFAVLGAHAQDSCESCHPLKPEPDDTGRKFGRVAEHFGKYTGCVTCHPDPHRGQFDGPDLPSTVDGRTDCARCHFDTSFRSLAADFDHDRWTGFAVVGAHAEIGCAPCHAPLRKPDELGRTWGRANGPACADCHADPHAGQFAVAGETDCQRCHVDDAEAYLDFKHDRDSRFALGEAHRLLECSVCHLPTRIRGVETVRYRPLKSECSDCHGVHEEVLLRKSPKKG